jgi:cytosine deaminase
VRLVCEALERQRLLVPVVCSHACSMALLPPRACQRLVDRMARLALGVVALPSTNLWLLDRRAEATPTRRAQAPIRQLQNSGVVVAVGGDNVQDAWFPGGDFDPLEVLRFAVVASHLHPWSRQGLSPFSTAAAQLLQLEWDGILRPGSPADLVVLDAHNWSDLLARSPQRRVMRSGVWLPKPEREEPAALLRGWGDWSA